MHREAATSRAAKAHAKSEQTRKARDRRQTRNATLGRRAARQTAPPVGDGGGGGGGGADLFEVSGTTAADLARLNGFVQMLAEMGFEATLCQKAVGMYRDHMAAAVDERSTDDQAQQQVRTLQRSPSWTLAEELANMLGAFSVGACKNQLARSANDANAAAMWLLDNGAAADLRSCRRTAAAAENECRGARDGSRTTTTSTCWAATCAPSRQAERQRAERAADEHPPRARAPPPPASATDGPPSGSLPTPRAEAAAAARPTPTSTTSSARRRPAAAARRASGLVGEPDGRRSRARGRTPPCVGRRRGRSQAPTTAWRAASSGRCR